MVRWNVSNSLPIYQLISTIVYLEMLPVRNTKVLVDENIKESLKEFPFVHLENNFLDYEREPLIPERLSVEGPALVTS